MVDIGGGGSGVELLNGGLSAGEYEGVTVITGGWFMEEEAATNVDGEEKVNGK